ncbi:MAG: COG3014 family protein [Planctomycetota bacterium]
MARLPLSLALLLACGCSTYPSRTAAAREAFAVGRFAEALERFPSDPEGPDRMLHALERGLIAHTAGDFERSLAEFEGALEAMQRFEDRPTVSGRSLVEGTKSWVWNDLSLPYDGEGFERVLLHTFLALDYLFLGSPQDARVEIRRADLVLREEEERHETRYLGANAFARWVGGLVYEGLGQAEDAALDYGAAHEKAPDCALVRRDLRRMARFLGRPELAEGLEEEPAGPEPGWDPGNGEVVCLYACGLGPLKEPIEIPVPTVHTVTKIAVPRFVRRENPAARLRVLLGGRVVGETELVEDLEETAIRNLQDRIARITAKAVARAAAKGAVGEVLAANRRDAEDAFLVGFAFSLFNLASEQADLRSWLTLPGNLQAARFEVPPGRHDLLLQLIGGNGEVLNTRPVEAVEVRAGRRVFLNLRSVDSNLFVAVIGGGSGPASAPAPPEG